MMNKRKQRQIKRKKGGRIEYDSSPAPNSPYTPNNEQMEQRNNYSEPSKNVGAERSFMHPAR